MSEKETKSEAPAKAPAAKAKSNDGAKIDAAMPGMNSKKQKEKWTAERALRAAKRFTTEDAWMKGAPASYKAALSKGWHRDCTKHMTATKTKKLKRSA